MNKIKALFLAAILLTMCVVPYATANETVVTPNKLIVFKISESKYYTQDIGSTIVSTVQMDTAPFIQNSRTFVPVRFLGNALGVSDSNITWDNNARKATLQGKSKLELTIGSKTMQKDNNSSVMDVAPIITNNRTMLPARYVAEGLGFKVEWDAENQLVIAYPEGQSKPDLTAIKAKLGIQTDNITVQNLGSSTGVQDIKADGYIIKVGNHPDDPTMFINIGDGSRPKQSIRVVCTSNPEFNKSVRPLINGEKHEFPMDVWTNNYMLFRTGYTSNPQPGMVVTFDIYGGYTGDDNATGIKIATIRKTLP